MDMCFYNVIPFNMYALIVQSLRINNFCMSEAVMRLVAGAFCYDKMTIQNDREVLERVGTS